MNAADGEKGNARLELLQSCSNGFEIAEADLKMRGPGEFLGARQSGEMSFKLSGLSGDVRILKTAGELAERMIKDGADEKEPVSALIEELIASISRNGLN
jgi:ATP-dependent DNA helicase RecG